MPSFSPRKKRLVLATVTLAASARAASVTLVASDPAATSSFDSANTPPTTGWSDGLAPAAGNDYLTGAFLLRTPLTGPATFAGDSLSIDAGGTLLLKGAGNSWTISNLILNGGGITQGDETTNPTTTTLIGGLSLAANSTIDLGGGGTNQRNITLNSTVSGSGTLTVNNTGSSTASTLTLGGTVANTNSGLLTVNGGILTLAKTAGVDATGGDITLNNAARINWTNANQIPDTATLTLNNTALLNRSGTSPAETIAALNLNTTAQSVLSGITVTGATTITTGTQHDLSSGASFTTGTLSMSGGSVLRLGANGSATTLTIGGGGLSLNASTLQIGQPGGAPTGRINLGGNVTSVGASAISVGNNSGPRELDLGAAARTFNVTDTLTVAAKVQNGSLVKTGAGTLVLSGANTMGTGTLTFGNATENRGAIRLASASALGGYTTVNMPANNTGISVLELSGGLTFNAVNITTAGRSTAQTTGATLVNVSGNNTWPGNVTINGTGGGYAIRSDAGTLTLSGNLVNGIANTRTWELGGTGNVTVSGIVQETGGQALSLNKFGTGVLTLSNTGNTYSGTTTAGTGTLRLGAANVIPDGAGKGDVVVNGTLDLNTFSETINGLSGTGTIDTVAGGTPTLTVGGNNATSSFGGVIQDTTGSLALAKIGTGTLTLGGNNSFAGGATISGGAIVAGNVSALGAAGSQVALSSGTGAGTLNLATDTSVNAWAVSMSSSNPGTLVANKATAASAGITHALGAAALGNNTLNVTAGANVSGGTPAVSLSSLNLSGGAPGTLTLNPTTASLLITGATNIGLNNQAKTLELSGTAAGNSITGLISNGLNTLTLTKSGSGTWTIGGASANTFTGGTTVNGGTLALAGGLAIPDTGTVTLANTAGAGLQLNASETIGSVSGGGATGGNINLQSFTLTTGGTNASTTFGGSFSGTGGLIKAGTGTFTLSGASTHAGATQVNAGILAISNNTALGTTAGATTVAANSSLALTGVTVTGETVTINGMGDNFNGALRATTSSTWAGPVILGDVNARLGAAATTTLTVSGAVTGSNPLYITGASGTGTVLLSAPAGQSTYAGPTAIVRGQLKLGADNTLPTTTVLDVDYGGAAEDSTFDLNNFNQTIGTLQRTGTGTGTGGSFITNSGATLKTLTVNQTANTSYDGIISGAANLALTKSGSGTLTLAGANSYTGATTVNGGTLALSGGAAIADGSPVTLSNTAGAGLLLNASETIGSLAGGGTTGGGVNVQGFTLTIGGDGTSTSYSGAITGTGALTKIGAGTQTLAGSAANAFSGTTTVSSGILSLNKTAGVNAVSGTVNVTGGTLSRAAANQIPDTAVVTISGTAIMQGSSAETIGTLNISSTGANILSGLNVTGTTTVSAGILHDINSTASFTTGTLAMSGGAVVRMGNNTAATTVNIGAGGLTLNGATLQMGQPGGVGTGLINLGGNITASGTSAVSVPNTLGARLLDLGAATRTVDVAAGGALTLAPAIQNGGLTKTGSGSLTLSGANTYAGATLVSGGTVFAASSTAFGSAAGGTTVGTGATVQTSGASGLSIPENFTLGGGTLRAGGNPAVDPVLTGNLTLTSSSTLQGDGNTAWTVSGTVNTGPSTSTLTVRQDGSETSEISGAIGGAGGLEKIGGGTLTLSNAANTYTGKTAVNGGMLTIPTGNEATLGAPAAAANALSISSGTLRITTASLTLDDAGRGVTVATAGTLDVAGGLTLALGNFVEGTGSALTKASAGTVDITAGAKFASFNVAGGRLRQSGGTVSAANGVVGLSGTYQLTGGTLRVDSMNVAGGFEWSNAVLTHNTTNTGNPIGTDVSSPGYQIVGVGNTATITGTLATGAGSVLALHSSPTLYLSGGVRFNAFHVAGDLNLGGAGDVLELELNPYLLRPFAQLGPAVFETGSLPLVTWTGTRTDEFDSLTGVLNDGRGFDLSAFPVSDPALLAGDTYWLEYDDSAQTIWFHYKVSGYVPEPGSFGLLAAGTLALRLARTLQDRRRRLGLAS